jgi:hypothetical protein
VGVVRRFGGWLKRVFWTRRAASTALVVLASLLALIAAFAIYVREVVLDTPTWANTTTKMLQDDRIRPVLAEYLVDELYATVNVTEEVGARLPSSLQGVAGVAAGALHQVAVDAANAFLDNPRVQELWKQANTITHERLLAAIESGEDEPVTLSLGPMIERLALRIGLPERAATALAGQAGEIVIIEADQVETVRNVTNALKKAAFWLLIASVVLWVAAVVVGRGRRREVVRAISIGLLTVGILLIVVRRFVGTEVVQSIVDVDSVEPAGIAAWLIATETLQEVTAIMMTLGLLGVLWAWLCGPTTWATSVRRWIGPTFRDHPIIPYTVFALIALILIAWGPLGNSNTLVGLGIVIVLLVLGIETFRRRVVAEAPPAPEPVPEGSAEP